MTAPVIDCAGIELGLCRYFDQRRNFLIPNVSWGWRGLNYEIDVMVVTSSLYSYDVEIKVSASDLRRDQKKDKWRYCRSQHYFRKSWFAMPVELHEYADLVPAHAGIILVSYNPKSHVIDAAAVREPEIDAAAKKVTESEMAELGRLCMLRMWDLRRGIWQRQQQHQGENQP